jgi:hypothetical protein
MNAKHNNSAGFAERIRLNQQVLWAALKPQQDFIVCGSGSSGSRGGEPAENPEVNVLLLEAMKTCRACVNLFREIGNSLPLRPFAKREVMPGTLKGTS